MKVCIHNAMLNAMETAEKNSHLHITTTDQLVCRPKSSPSAVTRGGESDCCH